MGAVRSLDRYVTRSDGVTQFKKGTILSPVVSTDGYLQLKLCKNGLEKGKRIHQLVAEAFVDKPNSDVVLEVNHIDCDRKNNRFDNLEWISHAKNVRYAIRQGNHFCTKDLIGVNNPNYGNHKLREVYKNKELAIEKLSRPGSQNGRAKGVQIIFDGDNSNTKSFSYIGECAIYLIANGYTNSNVNTVRAGISLSIKNNKKYLGFRFKFI